MSVHLNTQVSLQLSALAAHDALEAHASGAGSKATASIDDFPPLCPDRPPIPHPHAALGAALGHSSRFDQVALNPQPLPPGESAGRAQSVRADVDDIPLCPPPPPRPWLDSVGQVSREVSSALGLSAGQAGQAGQDRGIIIIGG